MKETIKTSKNDNKTKNNNLNKSLDYKPKCIFIYTKVN